MIRAKGRKTSFLISAYIFLSCIFRLGLAYLVKMDVVDSVYVFPNFTVWPLGSTATDSHAYVIPIRQSRGGFVRERSDKPAADAVESLAFSRGRPAVRAVATECIGKIP